MLAGAGAEADASSGVGGGGLSNRVSLTMINTSNLGRLWWNYIIDSPIRLFFFVLMILFGISAVDKIFEFVDITSLPLLWEILFFSSLASILLSCWGCCRLNVYNSTVQRSTLRMRMPTNRSELRSLLLRLSISGRDGDFTGNDYDLLNRLDEDIETGNGASQEQINNLPSYVYNVTRGDSTIGCDTNMDRLQHADDSLSPVSSSNSSSNTNSASGDPESDKCTICLSGYANGDNMRMLPCMHNYHALCIDEWLSRHSTCPICKQNI